MSWMGLRTQVCCASSDLRPRTCLQVLGLRALRGGAQRRRAPGGAFSDPDSGVRGRRGAPVRPRLATSRAAADRTRGCGGTACARARGIPTRRRGLRSPQRSATHSSSAGEHEDLADLCSRPTGGERRPAFGPHGIAHATGRGHAAAQPRLRHGLRRLGGGPEAPHVCCARLPRAACGGHGWPALGPRAPPQPGSTGLPAGGPIRVPRYGVRSGFFFAVFIASWRCRPPAARRMQPRPAVVRARGDVRSAAEQHLHPPVRLLQRCDMEGGRPVARPR